MHEYISAIGVSSCTVGVLWHLAREYFDLAKEVVDVCIGAVLLVLTSPIILVCALIIRFSDWGPALFVQVRVGKSGRLFRMYKLRSMYRDAESRSGAVWAGADDPRVIRACRWMRRSHVDELPQLINVVKREMSLVGPRPERPEILIKLEETYPQVTRRLAVRPGITGLAQIRNGYDTTLESFHHKLRADLEYIDNRNWTMELSILAKTLGKLNDPLSH
jgi:lipopolysaccharide/colanic/teichoic acid biosynthesis glycosyltransferase